MRGRLTFRHLSRNHPTPPAAADIAGSNLLEALGQLRDIALHETGHWLRVAADADRAMNAVQWALAHSTVTAFPPLYAEELARARQSMKAGLSDTSTVRSSLQMITSGATGAAVAATLGSAAPELLRAPNFKRSESQFALDEHLLGLWGTDELSQRRRTAWTRLFPDTAENCAEACHLLRQILAALFDQFASTTSVRKAAWWRPYVPAREGASYRDKLKFFVACNDDKGVSQPLLDELERQLDRALAAHTQAIKVAHGNVRSALEIAQAAMILLEEVTFTLLRYRRSLAVCA